MWKLGIDPESLGRTTKPTHQLLNTCVVVFGFYMGAGDPNIGPHIYLASTLQATPSPSPLNFILI